MSRVIDWASFVLGMGLMYMLIEVFGIPPLAHLLGRRARSGGR